MELPQGRWKQLCERLGCPAARVRFEEIRAAYGQRHRHYHTAQHIMECLAEFDKAKHLATEPDEVEFSLWLHDLIYRTRRNDNEDASAAVARSWLRDSKAGELVAGRVSRMIEATKHDSDPQTPDEALILDIDLNVLGAPISRYDEYEAQVRREYRWVPRALFNRKRADLLEAFWRRDPLYTTQWFQERLESAAKANLSRTLARLRGRPA